VHNMQMILDQVQPCLDALKPFTKLSGLNLKLHKTEGMYIGSISVYIPDDETIKWPTGPV
jgi:hypothetical protein